MKDPKRQTGRTTELLQTAAGFALQDKTVMVGCASFPHADQLARRFVRHHGGTLVSHPWAFTVRLECGEVMFLPASLVSLQGTHRSVVKLYDHWAAHYWLAEHVPEWVAKYLDSLFD